MHNHNFFLPLQLVVNSQRSVRRFSLHSLTAMGYAVVMIDTMGSSNRGIHFEAALKNNLVSEVFVMSL